MITRMIGQALQIARINSWLLGQIARQTSQKQKLTEHYEAIRVLVDSPGQVRALNIHSYKRSNEQINRIV
jgi:hypothetical protein